MENPDTSFALLDPSQIDMLLEDGSRESVEMFNEILELFEQECLSKFAELKSSKAEGNVAVFGNAAHTLAGSSANIGGAVVWKKAKAMENFCKSGESQSAFDMLDDLKADFANTLIQLKAYTARFQ